MTVNKMYPLQNLVNDFKLLINLPLRKEGQEVNKLNSEVLVPL